MAHLGAPLTFPLGGDAGGGALLGITFFPYGPYNANGENNDFLPGPDEMIGPLAASAAPGAVFAIGPTNDGATPLAVLTIGPSTVLQTQGTALGPTNGVTSGPTSIIGPTKGS